MLRFLIAALLALLPLPAMAQGYGAPNYSGYELKGARTGTQTTILSGSPANGTWASGTWFQRYHTGADFGNSVPIQSQFLIRCSTTADATQYQSCMNVDFYNNTGAALRWFPSTQYLAGTIVQINGAGQYRANNTGSSASVQPSWPNSGTVVDGSITWTYLNDGGANAKSGMSMTSVSTNNGGNHWLINPNCIVQSGFQSQLYCIELDVGNYSGADWTPTNGVRPVQALWIGGITTNTGSAAVNVGSQQSTAGKPAWYFAFWCGNALAAQQGCFEDWSNSYAGFHTASFATKTYDIHLQASSVSAFKPEGAYSNSAINLEAAQNSAAGLAVPTAIRIKAGDAVCLQGADKCLFFDAGSGRLTYQRGAQRLFSVDDNGNVRALGSVTGNTAP